MEGGSTYTGLALAVRYLTADLNAPFWSYVESLSFDLLDDAYLVRLNRIANTRSQIKELEEELRTHLAEFDCILNRRRDVRRAVSGNGRNDNKGLQRMRGLRPGNQAATLGGRSPRRGALGTRRLRKAA